jgi:hypothetical protein
MDATFWTSIPATRESEILKVSPFLRTDAGSRQNYLSISASNLDLKVMPKCLRGR